MAQFQLGSISTGTLRTEDLLPYFLETLTAMGGKIPSDLECGKYIEYINWPAPGTKACDYDDKFWDSDEAHWDMEALIDALNELCPPFVYFGTLEGDGADFGFWVDWDRLEEARQYIKIFPNEQPERPNNLEPDDEYLRDYNVIVQVSDHGNVTVMDMERNALWSMV
jgi:hypothetical protein